MHDLMRRRTAFVCLTFFVALTAAAQPAPRDFFGFEPGADRMLADYGQVTQYLTALDAASDRVKMVEIGRSVLGKPLFVLFISSEENLRHLEKWRSMSEALARARIDEATAHRYAHDGKAVVWIDGGLHASELAHGQMTPLLAYRVATEESDEMQAIRDRVILLLMPNMNPDGLDIMASWYRRNVGTPFETTGPPWLYHHYVGHDNNRDWFMNNMPETKAVNRVLYREWYPQIVYNHHQSSPAWARIFLPPFADPVNPNIHPGVTTGVNLVGTAMANRFAMRDMPGVISRVTFSMWWDGGMRTVPYFHNMIGILTETAHATPTPRFYDPDSLPKTIAGGIRTDGSDVFYPDPWKGGESHFRDPVKYMMTASMAVLRIASDRKEEWLYNIYTMGRDAIKKAEKDSVSAYVIPADQWDGGEAVNLVNVLFEGGIEVGRAISAFEAGGQSYPAGSFVIDGAQAFAPFVRDLLDPQHYPTRYRTPGGPPITPYDLAGWTLPMQMGVRVDRVNGPFDVETVPVAAPVHVSPGAVSGEASAGYILSPRANAVVRGVNRLLTEGEKVFRTEAPTTLNGIDYPAGAVYVRHGRHTTERVRALANSLGLDAMALSRKPDVGMHKMHTPRIGLYKSWVAPIDEGWTRWLLERYEFVVDTLHDADIRTRDLSRYDAVVLPHQSARAILNGHTPGTMPAEYVGGLGVEGAAALKRYVEDGGVLVALDGATDFAIAQFGLPVRNVTAGVSSTKFFIPGSLVRLVSDTHHPLAFGMQDTTAASFQRSRAFRIVRRSVKGEGGKATLAEGPEPPVEVVAWYANEDVLMSGWAQGAENTIGGKGAMLRVRMGNGSVVLFGFRPQFRGQPRGTYKLFFNALQQAALETPLPVIKPVATDG